MYRIAICDDNVEQTGITETVILKFFSTIDKEVQVDVFFKPKTLLKTMSNSRTGYQIIFLDIEMQEMNGIEVARRLRELEKRFLTCFYNGV